MLDSDDLFRTEALADAPMTADIIIRRAHSHDLQAILEIWVEGTVLATDHDLVHDEIARASDVFRHRLESPDQTFGVWVATNPENEILGWQSLQPFGVNPLRMQLEAESSTYVRRRTRQGRVGLELLRHAMQHSKKTSLHIIWGLALSSNRASIRMMIAADWQRVGALPILPREPDTAPLEVWVYPICK